MIRTLCLRSLGMFVLFGGFACLCSEPSHARADNVHVNINVVPQCKNNVQNGANLVQEILKMEKLILQMLMQQGGKNCQTGQNKSSGKGGKGKGGKDLVQGIQGGGKGAKGKGGKDIVHGVQGGGKGAKGKGGKDLVQGVQGGGKGAKGKGGNDQPRNPLQQPFPFPNGFPQQQPVKQPLQRPVTQQQPQRCGCNPQMLAVRQVGSRGTQPRQGPIGLPNQKKK